MQSKTINKSHRLPNPILRLLCLILLALSFIQTVETDATDLDQATINALYTYKFGKFTKWPDTKLNSTTKKFQLCIIGKNPFPQNALNLIIGKTVQGLPLTVDYFDSGFVLKKVLSACHILFISHSEKYRLSTILTSLKQMPVLTISDIPKFSYYGGMITLIENQRNLFFQINPQALQQANISISSKIMELAEIIDNGGS